MKNIETILTEAGLEVTAEQLTAINAAVKGNYRTITDYELQKEKLTQANEKVETLTTSLDKFKNVDVDQMTQTVEDLKKQLSTKDSEFEQKLKDRDFDDLLTGSIASAKGKNAKLIKALLADKLDNLKSSKNQKEDIETELKALAEAEDSKFLFGEPEDVIGGINPIGGVGKAGTNLSGVEKAFMERNPDIKLE